MGKNAVFRNEGGRDAVCVFVKKAVVANAKSDYNIEVSLLLVEELCLHDRVAHYLARYTGVFLGNSDVGLVHRADFTSDAVNFKAVELQDPCKDAAFFDKTNAGRNADLLCAYLVGKLDYLFNSGIFSVEAALDFGGGDSDLAVCAVFYVEVGNFVYFLIGESRSRSEFVIIAVSFKAVENAAVGAAVGAGRYFFFFGRHSFFSFSNKKAQHFIVAAHNSIYVHQNRTSHSEYKGAGQFFIHTASTAHHI